MRRKTLDSLLTTGGLALALILLVSGSLLTWGSTFVTNQVHDQLAAQKIFFPEKGEATADPRIGPFINQYSGQQLVTGEQARAYADHFIAVHLADASGGQTYSELSTASRADPENAELAAQVQTAFRGETLRGLLLNAYAFGKMGQIALIAAVVSFVGAGVMLLLSLLGVVHLRRVSPNEEVLTVPQRRTVPAPA